MKLQRELIIDNFAGGGGASTGIELATGRRVDIAINHDPAAIAMHMVNHPLTRHFCESVWNVDPRKVTRGKPVALAWFSPDCKHFSKAKGGKPVDKDIRGLAWVAVRWAATVRPRVIILENVEEFKTWGPVADGRPIKGQSGRTFNSFINALRDHGYTVDFRELKACDYGAPTIRKRFFLIARCDGCQITWPKPTYGDPKSDAVRRGKLKPWRTAAEIIEWTLPCPSIFATSEEIFAQYGLRAVRPLADATLRRIARGLKKFVFENPEPFIVDFKFDNAPKRSKEPLGTITSVNGYGLVAPTLIQYHGEQSSREVRGQDLSRPLLTADGANRYGLVMAFMSKYYSGGHQGSGNALTEPLNTVTAIDHNALVTSHLTIFRNGYSRGGQNLTEPLNTITAANGHFGEIRTQLLKIHGEQYAISDIGLRMLTPRELFNAQGFPPDYAIETGPDGKPITKSAQVARCGNAVPPPFAEALVRANLPELCGTKLDWSEENAG
ncbi:MAG: DNA cytosine methyltransferase [Defluviitaleaceae bacterium]|nr:DNA cytosine methyltransferase [Defluviitaleaceae bacterium]MCL2261650.1 DNA cytosine methyltransferase [Defluviitaleaceae bacterium]